MQGELKADFTSMPVSNMIVLFAGVAVLIILIAIAIVVIVRKLRIKSFGPFKMEHDSAATMYEMNEKIRDIDDICHKQMRYKTNNIKTHISNLFVKMNICVPTRISISSVIRFPLYESISNNHFTTELMPDQYSLYRDRIIENMKDEYISLESAPRDKECTRDVLPPWEQINERLIGCIDLWLKDISKEVMGACGKKIVVYKEFLRLFEGSKDDFRSGICKECIEKNERYIRELKRLI
jgi:hypothetical protein